LRQFEGGQSNPTFLLSAGGRDYVLRKKPPGRLLPSAHMVDREYRVMTALAGANVPVPRTDLLCEDDAIIGTPFFVMEYVRGRLFRDPTLPDVDRDERRAIYTDAARVLAELHNVDYEAVGLADYGRPGNYFARQLSRWTRQYESSKTDDIASIDRLMEWLPANLPDDDATGIVHGDYRLENMLFHPTEPRVIALLDWELSTLGHPLADLAYTCIAYHMEGRRGPLLDAAVIAQTGVLSEEEYVAEYCRRTGRDGIPNWGFYIAFSLFRLASITQGVYYRGLQGNAASQEALELARFVRIGADTGWALVESGA
ncbi:MAG: phosphotransferase, partial [Dehalococcoidia bacterium]